MRSLNRASLMGYVGAPPESRSTAGGTLVVKVSLATSRRWKDNSGSQQERTEWHRLTFFGKVAELAEKYVEKGAPILVEGEIRYSQTEKNGHTQYWTEIVVDQLYLLPSGGSPSSSSPGPSSSSGSSSRGGDFSEPDDDLPF